MAGKKQAEDIKIGAIDKAEDLKTYLLKIRTTMEEQSSSIYAVSAMNRILNFENIYDILDKENKEIARDIWLRILHSGVQLDRPPMLFTEEEILAAAC